jgi:hypothetical protein
MSITRTVKTNFTAGQLSPTLIGRGDLRAYDNGAATLENVFIYSTGGVTRRAGMNYLATLPGVGRLAAFEFNTEQVYLLAFTDSLITVFQGGVQITTLTAPWTMSQIPQINWVQSADTLLVVHPDVEPQQVTRSDSGWAIGPWVFDVDATTHVIDQPYYKFADPTVTVTPSANTGNITLTASASVFQSGHVGTRMRVGGQEISVTAVASGTQLTATVIETLASTAATIDWQEQSFSSVHGWPTAVTFHQNRLVIGGSRDLPNRLWLSQSDDLFNFDLGTALDSDAIEIGILSDQVNAICAVFSSRNLLVFTSGSEWCVLGDPLTPTSIDLEQQTRVGSQTAPLVPPVDVDGSTIFVSRTSNEVREFVFDYTQEAYTSTDLALLSHEMVLSPQSITFDQIRRLLFLVRGDGTFAALTLYPSESIVGWTLHNTLGTVLCIANAGDVVYALTQRGSSYFLEQFVDDLNLDASLTGTASTPTTTWGGLGYLTGQTVSIVADGIVQPTQEVISGTITLTVPASNVTVGLPFAHTVQPMPPNALGTDGGGRAGRLVEAQFRLQDTYSFVADTGLGLNTISLRQTVDGTVIGGAPPVYNGDLSVRGTGWTKNLTEPLWQIQDNTPLPFTLLSVISTISLN